MKEYILMGDIVKSSSKKGFPLLENFSKNIDSINKKFKKELKSQLKISLGDEFQCVTKSIVTAVQIIFELNELTLESAENYGLRYVLNFGEIETKISNKNPMLGKGLTDARKKIGEMKNSAPKYYVNLDDAEISKSDMLNEAFTLYQFFIDNWKSKDYPIVLAFINSENYKEVAQKIGVQTSTAWRREKSLNIRQYQTSKDLILKIAGL